jgi:epoxyqueuosine reductase QueG
VNKQISEFAASLGASDVGFADASGDYNTHAFKKAISIVVRLSDAVLDEIFTEPTYDYYRHYKAVNDLIDQITLRICLLLMDKGYQAYPIASSQSTGRFASSFPHKIAANLAGLGAIGRSTLFIHHRFGPRVRLGTVLTDAPIASGLPLPIKPCENCHLCSKACPASAIKDVEWEKDLPIEEMLDVYGCSTYMKSHFSKIGRGFVCGICIKNCPNVSFYQ